MSNDSNYKDINFKGDKHNTEILRNNSVNTCYHHYYYRKNESIKLTTLHIWQNGLWKMFWMKPNAYTISTLFTACTMVLSLWWSSFLRCHFPGKEEWCSMQLIRHITPNHLRFITFFVTITRQENMKLNKPVVHLPILDHAADSTFFSYCTKVNIKFFCEHTLLCMVMVIVMMG